MNGAEPCLYVPINETEDEVVAVPTSDLPEDVQDLLELLMAEEAPLSLWVDFARAYLAQGRVEQYIALLSEGTKEDLQAHFDTKPEAEQERFPRVQMLCAAAAVHLVEARDEAQRAQRARQLAAAADLLRTAAELLPDEQLVALGRGQLALAKGDTRAAGRELDRAARLPSNGAPNAAGMLALAGFCFQDGNYQRALRLYGQALRRCPGAPPEVRLNLAACHARLGDPARARAALERALALRPADGRALLGLASLALGRQAERGSERAGLELLCTAYAADPGQAAGLALLARFSLLRGEAAQAHALAAAALAAAGSGGGAGRAEAQALAAGALHALGQLQAAYDGYTQANRVKPSLPVPLLGLAQISVLSHRLELTNAVSLLEKALEHAPGWPHAVLVRAPQAPQHYHQLLARLYPHVRRTEPAVVRARIALFRTAAERNPDNGDVWEALGELSAPTDPAGALKAYQQALRLKRAALAGELRERERQQAARRARLKKARFATTFSSGRPPASADPGPGGAAAAAPEPAPAGAAAAAAPPLTAAPAEAGAGEPAPSGLPNGHVAPEEGEPPPLANGGPPPPSAAGAEAQLPGGREKAPAEPPPPAQARGAPAAPAAGEGNGGLDGAGADLDELEEALEAGEEGLRDLGEEAPAAAAPAADALPQLSARLLNNAGVLHSRAGHHAEALRLLAEALQATRALAGLPRLASSATIKFNQARALEAAGDGAAAEAGYRELLGLFPTNTDYPIRLAFLARSRGDYAAAKEWAGRVLRSEPDHPDALGFMGALHLQLREYAEAEAAFKRLTTGPEAAYGRLGLAALNQRTAPPASAQDKGRDEAKVAADRERREKQLRRALDVHQELLARDGANLHAAHGVGAALAERGHGREAQAALHQVREALAASEGFLRLPEAGVNLATLLVAQEQTQQAVNLYESVLQRHPGTPLGAALHLYIARAHYDAGDLRRAGRALAKALRVDPHDPRLHFNYAFVLQELAHRTLKKPRREGDTSKLQEITKALYYLRVACAGFKALARRPERVREARLRPRDLQMHVQFVEDTHDKARHALQRAQREEEVLQAARLQAAHDLQVLQERRAHEDALAREREGRAQLEREAKAREVQEKLQKLRQDWKEADTMKQAVKEGDASKVAKRRREDRAQQAVDALFAEDEDDEEYREGQESEGGEEEVQEQAAGDRDDEELLADAGLLTEEEETDAELPEGSGSEGSGGGARPKKAKKKRPKGGEAAGGAAKPPAKRKKKKRKAQAEGEGEGAEAGGKPKKKRKKLVQKAGKAAISTAPAEPAPAPAPAPATGEDALRELFDESDEDPGPSQQQQQQQQKRRRAALDSDDDSGAGAGAAPSEAPPPEEPEDELF